MTRSLALVVLAAALAGCASGPRSVFSSMYTPPAGHNQLADGVFLVTVDTIHSGGRATNFFADVTVRNVGDSDAVFDPAEIELFVPESGMTYQHITKSNTLVAMAMPFGFSVMSATHIKPGQAIAGSLWFQTPVHQARAKTLQLTYKNHELTLPPTTPAQVSRRD